MESYEAAFHRIQQMTGEEDIDYLVNHFIEVEDRNFALFNYVNEQNNEKEMLEEQIMQVGWWSDEGVVGQGVGLWENQQMDLMSNNK